MNLKKKFNDDYLLQNIYIIYLKTKTENNMRKTFSIQKINKLITVVACSVIDSISRKHFVLMVLSDDSLCCFFFSFKIS